MPCMGTHARLMGDAGALLSERCMQGNKIHITGVAEWRCIDIGSNSKLTFWRSAYRPMWQMPNVFIGRSLLITFPIPCIIYNRHQRAFIACPISPSATDRIDFGRSVCLRAQLNANYLTRLFHHVLVLHCLKKGSCCLGRTWFLT